MKVYQNHILQLSESTTFSFGNVLRTLLSGSRNVCLVDL